MAQGKQPKPQQAPGHENEIRLAGLILTFTLVLALLAAPIFR